LNTIPLWTKAVIIEAKNRAHTQGPFRQDKDPGYRHDGKPSFNL
jgi:hypothetical protein